MRGSVSGSFFGGGFDALRAWRLLAALCAILWLVALPAGLEVFESFRSSIGARGVAEELAGTMDLVWLGEYREAAKGVAATVDVPVLARTALLVDLEDWWRGELFAVPAAVLGLGLLWALAWTFATGLALDRFFWGAVGERRGSWPAVGARHFGRLARLALSSLPFYYAVYRLSAVLFPALEERLRDVTQERIVLGWYLVAALVVVSLLASVQLWFDYARVVAVGRDVPSTRRALVEAARWLLAHPLRALSLQLLLAAAGGLIVVLYLALCPAPEESSWIRVAAVLAGGQLALAARLLVRLTGLAARSRLYRDLPAA
ncbi:MAG: hypothetical protein R2991_10535 [Thermoanaerobaculia bacterium]